MARLRSLVGENLITPGFFTEDDQFVNPREAQRGRSRAGRPGPFSHYSARYAHEGDANRRGPRETYRRREEEPLDRDPEWNTREGLRQGLAFREQSDPDFDRDVEVVQPGAVRAGIPY